MSIITKRINRFFKDATKEDVNRLSDKILLSERQEKIFTMFYIKKQNINFIADSLFVSTMTINNELKAIRKKISKVMEEM